MNKEITPNWLKSMQNGSVGEARTKSFLIDRFWILERSVDIEGADFIIQRRLLGKSILDEEPTRFGIVQTKYSQDEKTYHHLKKEYVLDSDKNPRLDFFLILNIGSEDSQKMCLLTARDIAESFYKNEEEKYVLSTKEIIEKFEVKSKTLSLDRIEKSIQCAEFYKNRLFVFSKLVSTPSDFNSILPEYLEDSEYSNGNIPDLFREYKTRAFELIRKLEKMHAELIKFLEAVDPMEACLAAESFQYDFGYKINIPEIFSKDFYYLLKWHQEKINNLKNDGILDNYLLGKKFIYNEIHSFILNYSEPIKSTSVHFLEISYDPNDFSCFEVNNKIELIENFEQKEHYKYTLIKEGKIKLSIKIGIQREPILFNECIFMDLMERIYEQKYFVIEKIGEQNDNE